MRNVLLFILLLTAPVIMGKNNRSAEEREAAANSLVARMQTEKWTFYPETATFTGGVSVDGIRSKINVFEFIQDSVHIYLDFTSARTNSVSTRSEAMDMDYATQMDMHHFQALPPMYYVDGHVTEKRVTISKNKKSVNIYLTFQNNFSNSGYGKSNHNVLNINISVEDLQTSIRFQDIYIEGTYYGPIVFGADDEQED